LKDVKALKGFLLATILFFGALLSPLAQMSGQVTRGGQSVGASQKHLNLNAAEIAALINECGARTTHMARRIINYTYTEAAIEYELDTRGQVKRERSKVYEMYPVRGHRWVSVQLSEDGVAFGAEKVGRERERAAKNLVKAEEAQEAQQRKQQSQSTSVLQTSNRKFTTFGIRVERHERGGLSKTHWIIRPTDFFESHEFHTPRTASFKGREAILLGFRPRPGYVYDKTNVTFRDGVEEYGRVVGQLGGNIWIDARDKVLMRLDAMPLSELSRPGTSAVEDAPNDDAPLGFELTRMADGAWVPSRSWYNSYGRENVFWKTGVSRARKYSDFKLFSTRVEGVELNAPRTQP
jgi:hypothetical protein